MKRPAAILLLAMLTGCRGGSTPMVQMAYAAERLCNDLKAQPFIRGLPVKQQDFAAAGAVARDTAKRFGLGLVDGADLMANLLKQRGNQPLAQFACGSPSFTDNPETIERVPLKEDGDPLRDDERQAANGCAAVMQFFGIPDKTGAEICAADLLVHFPIGVDRARRAVEWSAAPGAAIVSIAEKQAAKDEGCKMLSEAIAHPDQSNVPKNEAAAHRAAADFAIARRLDISLSRADVIYEGILQPRTATAAQFAKAATFKDIFCGAEH